MSSSENFVDLPRAAASHAVQVDSGFAHDHLEPVAPRARSHRQPAVTESVHARAGESGPAADGSTFAGLSLASPVLRALEQEGYRTPTPIQAKAIPPIMEGRDLLGCAQTGTGKTAAFALPILHRLVKAEPDKTLRGPVLPRVLVLSPTRELATQIGDSFAAYGRYTDLSHATIYGGVSQFHQVRALEHGVDILVATPGRLIDLMQQRRVDLSRVQVFVLDEADRMLDMGFIQPIRRIASALPKQRQTLLFSATMPREIVGLAESLLRDPVRVSVTPVASAAPLIDQLVYMIDRPRKQALLEHLLKGGEGGPTSGTTVSRGLVFTRTKRGADVVTRRLADAGITAVAIHGNKAQNQRTRALDAFRSGRTRVLVATDVAARGIDIDNVSHVFNYDLPDEPESYVHRIGRTGRAGSRGVAIALCDGEEVSQLRQIERLTGKRVEVAAPIANLPERKRTTHDETRAESDRPVRRQSQRTDHRGGGRTAAHAHPGAASHPHGHGHPANRKKDGRPQGPARSRNQQDSGHPASRRSSGHPLGSGQHPAASPGSGKRSGHGPAKQGSGPRVGMNHFRGKPRRGGH
ncbi:MAG: hypothetical protein AMXMBFR58_19030 [Phycisphaerae bacterium]|nr:ATP-dependent RNA helicase RhlE [Phycisphaerales bacterium]